MRINIGKRYRLTTDEHCWVLERLRAKKEGSRAAPRWAALGYYGSLELALRGMADKSIRTAETVGLQELQTHVAGLCADLAAAFSVTPAGRPSEVHAPHNSDQHAVYSPQDQHGDSR